MSGTKPIRRIAVIGTGVIGASWSAPVPGEGPGKYFAGNELRVSIAPSGAEMFALLDKAASDLVVLDLRPAGSYC